MTSPPINDLGRSAPAGLAALLTNLIDYAGLFPPARLDMATMVANYARALAGPDAWMIERVIVPVARLAEFEAAAAELLPAAETDPDAEDPSAIWPISALTRPSDDPELEADLDAIVAFNRRLHGRANIDTIELRGGTMDAIDAALERVPEDIFTFVELPIADDPRGLIAGLVGREAGAKVRTGGVTPDLYPSPEHLARFIAACATTVVPFKATAGLHHPLRHTSSAVGADEFGFLNVFVAAVLAFAGGLDADALLPVLEERDAGAFTFDHDGLAWRDRRVSTPEIEDARLTFATSFGSCSMDEPRDDLRELGLLPSDAS